MEDIENMDLVEGVEEENEANSSEFGFRYVCPACTGIGYVSKDKVENHPQSNCRNCGAVLGEVFMENFIPLTEDEKERFS